MDTPLALVIEDSPTITEIFTLALQEAGYTVEASHDGRVALETLSKIVPDIAIIDLHLPGVPGEKLADIIIHDKRLKHTHIIIVSVDARRAETMRNNDKIDLVLIKPVSFDQIRDLAIRFKSQIRQPRA